MDCIAVFLGCFGFVCGLILCIVRFWKLNNANNANSIALIFFKGFLKLNGEVPLYALPRNEQAAVMPVEPEKDMDSYNPEDVSKSYGYIARTVQSRVYHGSVNRAYIAAIGSVPYLYIMGTILRDGHLPFRLLDHNRSLNKWERLDDVGESRTVKYSFEGSSDRSQISEKLKKKSSEPCGVAISFTLDIRREDLPECVQNRTVYLELDTSKRFDVLNCESVQEEVAKEVAHFLNDIGRNASEIHLFCCSQASFAFRLGMLYQDGMTGKVIMHNYDAKSQFYPWAISFDGNKAEPVRRKGRPAPGPLEGVRVPALVNPDS